ncbi:MAG: PAS domain S-box protein [Gemmataceae bacterium]
MKVAPDQLPWPAPRIAGVYLLFGLLWVWLSDLIMGWQANLPFTDTVVAGLKGSVFVGLSALLVYWLGRRYFHQTSRIKDELLARERLFRTFVDHATDAFFLHGPGGTILDVNQQACLALGYSRDELLGQTILLFDPCTTEAEINGLVPHLLKGEMISFETIHRHRNGTEFPVEIRSQGFEQGGQLYAVSLARNISDRRQAEEKLRRSEMLLRTIIDNARAFIFTKDLEGRFLVVNHYTLEMLRRRADEVLGQTVFDLFPAAQAEEYTSSDRRVLETGTTVEVEETVLIDGQPHIFYSIKFPLRNGSAHPTALGTVSTDITARKAAEVALRESEDRYRRLVDVLPTAVFIDRDERITFCNSAYLALIGAHRPEQVLGRSIYDFAPPEYRSMMRQRRRGLFASGQSNPGSEQQALRLDGDRVPVHVVATPIVDQGSPAILVALYDLTERVHLEAQVRQAQKMEAVGQLAGGVAHDFNNLLTIINGYSEILLAGLQPSDAAHEPLQTIREAGERAASLTRQLLAFGRKSILQPKLLDLNLIVESIGKLLRRLLGEKVQLITSLHSNLLPIRADPNQLEQVLMNLAVNARDAMPGGGQLSISTDNAGPGDPDLARLPHLLPGSYVRLRVTDTGCGMTEEVMQHIFEPFFTTKEVGQGSGLGLAMVYGIVRMALGHIGVTSTPGQGTTFTLLLPAITSFSNQGQTDRESRIEALPHGTETVLLVEDEAEVRDLARQMLIQQGYQLLFAQNGAEALALARSYPAPIHLLVTDVIMPGMCGGELATALRRERPELRVLFVSGYNDNEVIRHGVTRAEEQYLEKPFTPLSLGRAVRAALDQPSPGPG